LPLPLRSGRGIAVMRNRQARAAISVPKISPQRLTSLSPLFFKDLTNGFH
jgi:hypothetical protein